MLVFEEHNQVFDQVRQWKADNFRTAFVPTMGNLHAGHMSLVEQAKKVADRVIVSIFVNPMQFSAGEDFSDYPRTQAEDQVLLEAAGVDLLYLPSNASIYPEGVKSSTRINVPHLSDTLCGESRPDHFVGVVTVVCKLFNITQADIAIFGRKDFQQVAIIRKMVSDLFLPVQILTGETCREPDGLAMSSRNQYLENDQRQIAPGLYEMMRSSVAAVIAGADVEQQARVGAEKIRKMGFDPEYVQFCDPTSLKPAVNGQKEMVLVVAAKLGSTRLIDNLSFTLQKSS